MKAAAKLTSRIRIVALYKLLLETDADHPVTTSDIKKYLTEEWGIESIYHKVIADDIEALKVIDIRIHSESGKKGSNRFYTQNKFWLDK